MTRSELGYATWVLCRRLWDSPRTEPPNMPWTYWKEIRWQYLERPTVKIENKKNQGLCENSSASCFTGNASTLPTGTPRPCAVANAVESSVTP